MSKAEDILNFRNSQSKASKSGEAYPLKRMRRLRSSSAIRDLLQENHIHTHDLIYPIFVEEDIQERQAISSLPGLYRESEKSYLKAIQNAHEENIRAIILFGVSHNKDSHGSDCLHKNGLLYRMVDNAKQHNPDLCVIADICFCEYTTHGHCGELNDKGYVDNDRTLDNLAQQAIIAAQAGADIVAPSGMMDGMVYAIRNALDSEGYQNVAILSYAAKFSSAFYGPFRDAAGCSLGEKGSTQKASNANIISSDRKAYQMNPANALEALREVELDLQEGADMIMVKPGLAYLDIIHQVKSSFGVPTFAYHVSGEYAMLKAASENGGLDYEQALEETMLSFKRAGADAIISYSAIDMAKLLNK